jgi:hypothetical protein
MAALTLWKMPLACVTNKFRFMVLIVPREAKVFCVACVLSEPLFAETALEDGDRDMHNLDRGEWMFRVDLE